MRNAKAPHPKVRGLQLNGSNREDAHGVFTEAGDRTAHETTGGLGGDAQVLADFAEALALAVEQSESGLHGVAGPLVEGAEQFVGGAVQRVAGERATDGAHGVGGLAGGERDQGEPRGDFTGEPVEISGLLDLRDEGYGFLRASGYLPGRNDAYVSASQVRRFALRKGDFVQGATRPAASNEKYPALLRVDTVADRFRAAAPEAADFNEIREWCDQHCRDRYYMLPPWKDVKGAEWLIKRKNRSIHNQGPGKAHPLFHAT